MTPRVRPATVSDAGAIAAVHSESWRLTYAGLLSPRYLAALEIEDLTESWRRRLARTRGAPIAVSEEGGQVMGFARYAPCSGDDDLVGFAGEIEMLYVHPRAQR
ncbi:MAG TPA: GNAT family N-acetyltransferase, partial [Kofleriaceae bacterium]|nr:GNAT family N-acetyltransferase [Kofleriaceae bacterium]